MSTAANDDFYETLPELSQFEGVADPANYKPLPDGWLLAVADVVGSTQAIAEGRYKDVNMAGAAVISAVMNVLGRKAYPFIFGGDGAMVALPPSASAAARQALAEVHNWVREALRLDMRVALVPVQDIRQAGYDVGVARFAASADASYAMFNGGGASWAEAEMKAGRYLVQDTTAGSLPDLTGLSCRWEPIPAKHGRILSIIAKPVSSDTMEGFRHLVRQLIALTAELDRGSHPIPAEGPPLNYRARNIAKEVSAVSGFQRKLAAFLRARFEVWLVIWLYRFSGRLGRFDARQYARDVAANSDFRKFDDGLKMTVDIDDSHFARIKALLEEAQAQGICEFGLHSQPQALMTCFVFSPLSRNHVHFIDGANGGYALAAGQLSSRRQMGLS